MRSIRWFEDLFIGHRFAVFSLGLLSTLILLFVLVLLWPESESVFGAVAADFKTWCFSYDPATGQVNAVWTVVMFLNPLMLIAIIGAVWSQPIRDAWRRDRRSVARIMLVSGAVSTLLAGGVLGSTPPPKTTLPFPAEKLRLSLEPPAFELDNQAGDHVNLRDLRGRVVLLTAVYATCHDTCPTIITTIRSAVADLTDEQRRDLTVVAISLDPRNDTLERRAATARAHQLEAPFFNYVNGDPPVVEALLDQFAFARIANEDKGTIDHSNMFVLIDRDQRIAYRLSLSDDRQPWLGSALRVLLQE